LSQSGETKLLLFVIAEDAGEKEKRGLVLPGVFTKLAFSYDMVIMVIITI